MGKDLTELRASLDTEETGSCGKRDEVTRDWQEEDSDVDWGWRSLGQGTWLGHMVDRRAGPEWDPMGNRGSEQGSEVFGGTGDYLGAVSVC